MLLALLAVLPVVGAFNQGSCLGSVCGPHGSCHAGPVSIGNESTYWCRCDEGFGGHFCERQCGLECGFERKCVFRENGREKCVCKDCDTNGLLPRKQPDCQPGYGGKNCATFGWCYPNSCRNGGECVGVDGFAKCACPSGFQGNECQLDRDECRESPNICGPGRVCVNTVGSYLCAQSGNSSSVEFKPTACFVEVSPKYPDGRSHHCQNGGFCDKSGSRRKARCQCPPGFKGSTCEISPRVDDPCLSDPCNNNGRCISLNGRFECACDDGYNGTYCEDGRDNCAQNKCAAGSVCINGFNKYVCKCPKGKTGVYCEKTTCDSVPGICNHGTCFHEPTSELPFQCRCEPGFTGDLCDQDLDECRFGNVCQNNGTCVNLAGSFTCECPRGFSGQFCEKLEDVCRADSCDNGGTCNHTSDRSIVCQCKNGFIGSRCEKACPPGYGGVRCDLRLESGICSPAGVKCFNGGICREKFCECPPDFTGNQCETARNEAPRKTTSPNTCKSNPCMNNATCFDVEENIGFACICQQGFEGDLCERRNDLCSENPCANGGECLLIRDSFVCKCLDGFNGERCENEKRLICTHSTCKNGGICVNEGAVMKCECPFGYTGHRCEEKINLGVFLDKDALLRSVCEERKCWERANDGNCDADCNHAACKFDGGDCSGKREPFSRCNYGNMCADLFSNGVCDQACNNEDCLYDGMDCMSAVVRCPVKIREHCAARFANGVCDAECNTDGCGFDGGDCANRTESSILTDIRIQVQIEPKEFQSTGGQTLMTISSALRAAVRIQRDEEGPLVFEWDGEEEGKRVEMDVEQLAQQRVLSTSFARKIRSIRGVVVYLEVQEDCIRGRCLYRDAQSVVDIISARLAKKGTNSFGVPISEAIIARPKIAGTTQGSSWNKIILIIGGGCFLLTASAGILTVRDSRNRKRKTIHAQTWIPPMDHSTDKGRRNQSINSSQHSLLEPNEYYAKRYRNNYDLDQQNAQYSQYGMYGNGYMADFGMPQMEVPQQPRSSQENAVKEIPLLHIQAAGLGPITADLTEESVNRKDPIHQRTVLHCLAANKLGKSEELIADEVKMCIAAGADVNARDCDENTALMIAVKAQKARVVLHLMRNGADPTIYNKSERSALHEAVVNRDRKIVKYLLTDARMIKDIDQLDRKGMTALMEVARSEANNQLELAEDLLDAGAKIDADGSDRKDSPIYRGRTALHEAALVNNLQMVKYLVSRNANKDKQDEDGRTPIMLAANEGHAETVHFLVTHGASVDVTDSKDYSARQLAQENKHHNVLRILENCLDVDFSAIRQQQQQHPPLPAAAPAPRKLTRPNFKTVKKQNQQKVKKESPAAVSASTSRDSTHLTPPPSDGSTSSPSPQHFLLTTNQTTPPSLTYMSPEYQGAAEFQPQYAAHPWYTASPTYPTEQMMHQQEAAYPYY